MALADELNVTVAPNFVGQANAPRFMQLSSSPRTAALRMAVSSGVAGRGVAVTTNLPRRDGCPEER